MKMLNFKKYIETVNVWDTFKQTHFAGENNLADDFYCWLRYDGMSPQDYDAEALERLFNRWNKSAAKGKWCEKTDRKRNRERRQQFGPGKYWAPTSTGVHLNKNFVKGWRGVNPKNP